MLYVQTNYHEELIKKISKYIRDGQIIVISPGYFSTAYFLKYCKGKNITIVETQSSFIDCRISEPGKIRVGFRNVRNPIGIYPAENFKKVQLKLEKLGFLFYYLDNVVEAALHNPNMIVHTVGAIMSIPMIDREGKEFCMYHSAFTEHVWNILERLDIEKMDILEKLGCERISYVEACKFRNSLNDECDAKQVFLDYAAMPTRAKAPSKVESRYILEDVSQGLVMLESLGRICGVLTPICTSLIEISSAAIGKNLREDGRTIERLGRENINKLLTV